MRLVMCRSLLLLAVLGAVAVPSHALLRKGDIELPKLLKCPEDIDCDCNPFTLTANEYIGCINAALPEGDAPVTPPTCSDKLSTEAYASCLETCLVDEGDAIGYLLCLRDFIKQDLDKFGLDKLSAAFAAPILPLPKIPECPLPPYSAAQPPVEPCTDFCNPEEGDWFEYTECLALYYADDEVPDFEPPYCSPKLPYDDYQACTTDCDIEDSATEYVECLAEAVKTYYEDSKLSLFDLHKKKQKCDPCADPINCPCDPWKELCSACEPLECEGPPGPPTEFTSIEPTQPAPSSLGFSWVPPVDEGLDAPLATYTVQCTAPGDGDIEATVPATETSVTLTGFQDNNLYKCVVVATNQKCTSEPSTPTGLYCISGICFADNGFRFTIEWGFSNPEISSDIDLHAISPGSPRCETYFGDTDGCPQVELDRDTTFVAPGTRGIENIANRAGDPIVSGVYHVGIVFYSGNPAGEQVTWTFRLPDGSTITDWDGVPVPVSEQGGIYSGTLLIAPSNTLMNDYTNVDPEKPPGSWRSNRPGRYFTVTVP